MLGDVANSCDIGSYVFSNVAVSTGRRAHKLTLQVKQANRQSVYLRVHRKRDRLISSQTQKPPNSVYKVVHVRIGKNIVQRQHRSAVSDFPKSITWSWSNALLWVFLPLDSQLFSE